MASTPMTRSHRERFFRGARKMAQLQHQGIVRVIEPQLEEEGYHFFVMEYVEGGDLQAVVLAGGLGGVSGLRILKGVAEALDFAHRRGLIHRDIKPANILLTSTGEAKLTDFDLVRAGDTTGGTRTGKMLGSFLYAAPESMSQAKEVDSRADLYSLAMTMVFVLAGRELPLGAFKDVEGFLEGLEAPSDLKRTLAAATSWDPEKRPDSASELWFAIERGGAAGKRKWTAGSRVSMSS